MRIFITAMNDPLYTLDLLKDVIDARADEVVGVAFSRSNRLTVGKKRSKVVYVASLFLIMGPRAFTRNAVRTLRFRLKEFFSRRLDSVEAPNLLAYARSKGIPVYDVPSVNDPAFLDVLRAAKPDVVINQANDIVKGDFLKIPSIGTINRHNALLPKNRGRLTPFWVAFRSEPETAVSIHFVEEGIDSGDIIAQRRYPLTPEDDFNSIVEKNYGIASDVLLEALDRLEQGLPPQVINDDDEATYNTLPTFKEALQYRIGRIARRRS